MGGGQSLFYPDNPHRHDRAEQLANDCTDIQNAYNATKAEIEADLGPYKQKLDQLLAAFGCSNIDEFDELITKSATGDALANWKEVSASYDRSQEVDQVIMGAEGVVALVGLTVSIVGAAAGGIGFFAGLAATADIMLVLGVIGAIFDIIDGAIQRSKLRDAINSLFKSRMKVKFVQDQADQLKMCIPSIKTIYQTYESLHYDKEQILEKFKDHNWLKDLQTATANVTYDSVGQQLADQDQARGSWTNEDPDWHGLVQELNQDLANQRASDAASEAAAAAVAAVGNTITGILSHGPAVVVRSAAPGVPMTAAPRHVDTTSREAVKTANLSSFDKGPDGDILVRLNGVAPFLQAPLHLRLVNFIDNDSAAVRILEDNDAQALAVLPPGETASVVPAAATAEPWTMRFIDPADAAKFSTAVQKVNTKIRPQVVGVSIEVNGKYLTTDGRMIDSYDPPQAEFQASYA
jgi:hypothetical protein